MGGRGLERRREALTPETDEWRAAGEASALDLRDAGFGFSTVSSSATGVGSRAGASGNRDGQLPASLSTANIGDASQSEYCGEGSYADEGVVMWVSAVELGADASVTSKNSSAGDM